MPLYYLVHDGVFFHEQIRPALQASWRDRSFVGLRELCTSLTPAARDFARRYHLAEGEGVIEGILNGQRFDRQLWRHLVGEILWVSALDIPEIQTAPESLTAILSPGKSDLQGMDRQAMPPIGQVHYGSRDLVFGGGYYQPDRAGWNDVPDVVRLSAYLESVQASAWQPADLNSCCAMDECEGELAFLRDWFPSLQGLYRQAADRKAVLICERVGP